MQDSSFLVLARVEQRQHRNGEAGVEQTELQAAVHVRAVGRGQPEGRGRHAAVVVVVVVIRQGVQVRVYLQLQQQAQRAAADLPALRPGQ